MAVATSYGTKGTERGLVMTGTRWPGDGTRTAVLWAHGHAGTGVGEMTSPDNGRVLRKLGDGGLAVVSSDYGGGTTWGDDAAQTKLSDAYSFATTTLGAKSGKVLLGGWSMGVLAVLNWARANPSKVAAIACVLPAVDLVDLHDNNRAGFKAEIESTYGLGSVPSVAGNATIAAHDPAQNTGAYIGVPIKLWYSSDDSVVIPSVVTTFASNTGAQTQSLGAVGHTLTSVDENQVLAFLGQYA